MKTNNLEIFLDWWKSFKKSSINHIRDNTLYQYLSLLLFSILVGTLAGLATICFYWLLKALHFFSFYYLVRHVPGFPRYGIAVFPLLGGLIAGFMIYLAPHLARQKGVVEIIKAYFLTAGIIRLKTVLYQFIGPVFFLGLGGTLGPESPVAQLGGGVGSLLGQLFQLPVQRRKIFLAAGTAAAIAAVFNAPIGGVFFSIEIVLFNNFQTLTFSALIVAAVAGSYVSRILLSEAPLLALPLANLRLSPAILLYCILGLSVGAIALLFLFLSRRLNDWRDRWVKKVPLYWLIVIPMALLGVAGVFFPQLLGIGYEAVIGFAKGGQSVWLIFCLVALKFIFVLLLHNAGGFGGLFAPSLFLGAGVGALFHIFVTNVLAIDLDLASCVISGMAAMLAGINSIPVTALLIMMELTGNYRLALPLMLSIIFSYLVVHYFLRETVYAFELKRQGIQLNDGKELNVLKNIKIRQIMSPEFHKVYTTMPLRAIIKIFAASSANLYWVEDVNGKLIGYIAWSDLKPLITDFERLEPLVTVSDIMNQNLITVQPEYDLDYVMKLFGCTNLDELPVVDPETQHLIGTVHRNRVIQLYNQEIFKRETAGDLAANLRFADQVRLVEIDEDFAILEINAPEELHNRDLQTLNMRKRYDLQVVLIKRQHSHQGKTFIVPSSGTIILPGDILVLAGPTRKVHNFRERYMA